MDNIVPYLTLVDDTDVQHNLAAYLQQRRKAMRLSRESLAQRSGVPAPTIKRFESTAQISLRQFLRLWFVLDDIQRLNALCQETQASAPRSIAEVLSHEF